MNRNRTRFFIILLIFVNLLVVTGCTSFSPQKEEVLLQKETVNEFYDIILGVGDQIEITVYPKKTSQFFLVAGDSIKISVYRQPKLDRTITVDFLGTIMFPLIGDIQAAGKTVFDLRDEIQKKLSKYIINPQVTITVSSTKKLKYDDLSQKLKIDSSGKIMFPLIGDVLAAQKTRFELRDEIQQRFSKYLVDPQVTINVIKILSQKVHVLGEVKSPGAFTLNRRIFALGAISSAGGFTQDANEEKVLLLRRENGGRKVVGLNLNIKKMRKNNKLLQSVILKNGDIIYVPPSTIVNIERFLKRIENIIQPFVTLETGIVLFPQMIDVLTGKDSSSNVIIP